MPRALTHGGVAKLAEAPGFYPGEETPLQVRTLSPPPKPDRPGLSGSFPGSTTGSASRSEREGLQVRTLPWDLGPPGPQVVAVAQLVERRVVVAEVAGSRPVGHPIWPARASGPLGHLWRTTHGVDMGINFTFAVADGPAPQIGVPCVCRSKMSCACEDFAYYEMCEHTGDGVCEHNRFDVPMTNSSAQSVLDRLGFEFDYVGTVDADEFLNRTVAAPGVHRQVELLRLATEAKQRRVSIGWC